jgi:hypothetical protein
MKGERENRKTRRREGLRIVSLILSPGFASSLLPVNLSKQDQVFLDPEGGPKRKGAPPVRSAPFSRYER